jgi:hypothetical protein
MLSTLAWVPRGVAKQRPDMYDDAAAAMAGMSMDDDGPASADDAVAAAAAAAARMNDSSDEDSDGGAKMDGAAAGDAAGIVQKYNLQVRACVRAPCGSCVRLLAGCPCCLVTGARPPSPRCPAPRPL